MRQTRFFAKPTRRSPISRLPTELLDAIFAFYASECTEINPNKLGDPLEASRTVSHVSSRWRDVALNNPWLWNRITLIHWWKKEGRLEWIKYMIKRTRNAPLTLRIWVGHGWDEDWDQNMALILTSLLPRVEVFDLRLDSSYYPTENFRKALVSASAPLLESLKVAPYNFLSHEPIDPSRFEPIFPPAMPKLTRVQYELDWNYVPYSSLFNVTRFKMTASARHGNSLFTPLRCIQLLNSMPLLEELSLSINFTDLEPESLELDPDTLELRLAHLKYFYLDAVSSDCSLLLPWFIFNRGCVVDVRCTDSVIDGNHLLVRQVMSYYPSDTELDMAGKIFTINILHDAISLVVSSIYPSSEASDDQTLFRFTTVIRDDDESENSDDQEESRNHAMLAHLVRTAHFMGLTKCSELHLNVDVSFFVEDFMAPILGPLIRACKNIKTLVLKGTRNGFMRPWIFNSINNTGTTFDANIFRDIDEVHRMEGSGDGRDELARWDFKDLMNLVMAAAHPEFRILMLCGPPKVTLKTVRILHTEFDVSSRKARLRLAEFLAWRDRQIPVVDNLLWPVRSISKDTTTDSHLHEITMADMIHNYLKPTRVLI
ncbi:hypothetical protein M413DRAFT_440464 [Hebeloma cylindrosporum]|uniref:F-box domain-containing protein n=1 Tax=Hebeloma cylindrosporum TaxID=76867 RepID=A0A0C3CS36_HEBCY|nr:hypothetical protein M413DRAFT_440464 [Hebeloma cylindrosporum h7]